MALLGTVKPGKQAGKADTLKSVLGTEPMTCADTYTRPGRVLSHIGDEEEAEDITDCVVWGGWP